MTKFNIDESSGGEINSELDVIFVINSGNGNALKGESRGNGAGVLDYAKGLSDFELFTALLMSILMEQQIQIDEIKHE